MVSGGGAAYAVSNLLRWDMMDFMLVIAHCVNPLIIGTRLVPVSVSEYSTRIGTSGNTVRQTNPSASRMWSVLASTFDDMSGMSLPSWLKRVLPFSLKIRIMSSDHLLPKRATTFLMGQSSMMEFFSIFFAIVMC